jgi:two-component system, chemotaxis family, chemotaxis protein CheY
MKNPTDITVLISAQNVSIARTLRMALRGLGLRSIPLAADIEQTVAAFAVAEPDAVIVYVDGPSPTDDGLTTLRFLRRSEQSPAKQIPIVAVSPQRDLPTINAVIEGGAHEYVLFPASGDNLLKKITAARTSTRPFLDTPEYVGPERRQRGASFAGPERRTEEQQKPPASEAG